MVEVRHLAEILKQHLTDKAAAYMAKIQALNALPDKAMRAAYSFIKEHCSGIQVTLREFRLILKNTGKMAGEKLKALTDWVKQKPAHYDKIEAEGFELLQEEEAKKNGYPSAVKCYQNWQARIEDELKAYTIEIEEAKRLGLDNVVAQLEKNFEEERQLLFKCTVQ